MNTTLTHPREPLGFTSLLCSGCGYGVAGTTPPGLCPMCRGNAWKPYPTSAAPSASG